MPGARHETERDKRVLLGNCDTFYILLFLSYVSMSALRHLWRSSTTFNSAILVIRACFIVSY